MNLSFGLREIADKIREGRRIDRDEALILYRHADFLELGKLASVVRFNHRPEQRVSFLIDRNINYTNVCNSDCSFCGFYRHDPRDPESYVLSRETIGSKIEEALALGATRILLQGGHNDELPYSFYTDLISWISSNYAIEINSFSPSEIQQIAKVSGKSSKEVLMELKICGMAGLPGGGAEILDDDIRRRVSPKKLKADEWIAIMKEAQELELTTTATMVIGFGETLENRLNHLQRLRDLQDHSHSLGKAGFNAFISWPLQHNENTSMGRSRHAEKYGATGMEYLRNTALARIFLDNIPHHQASWPTLGIDIAKVALHFGCDDIGSTMMEENVVSKAGALTQQKWSMSPDELIASIKDAGFEACQRNSSFEILRVFE